MADKSCVPVLGPSVATVPVHIIRVTLWTRDLLWSPSWQKLLVCAEEGRSLMYREFGSSWLHRLPSQKFLLQRDLTSWV